MSSFDSNRIRRYMDGTEVLEYGIDYYLCEDETRTEAEAAELAYAFALKYCSKWYRRDRKDPETRHRRAYDSFAQRVQDKQYFYSKRRRKLEEAEKKNAAVTEEERQKLLENERRRVAALRERCVAKGLSFEKENIKQLKRRYVAQKIRKAVQAACGFIAVISIGGCCYNLELDFLDCLFTVAFTLAVLLLDLGIMLLFSRPGKDLPDEVFDPIRKKKK